LYRVKVCVESSCQGVG